MQELRDKLRKEIMGNNGIAASKVVKIREGMEVKVKAPSLLEKSKLIDKCTVNGSVDNLSYMIWSVILFTYEPKGNTKLFDKEDYDTFANKPDDGITDRIFLEICNLESKGIDAEKKS